MPGRRRSPASCWRPGCRRRKGAWRWWRSGAVPGPLPAGGDRRAHWGTFPPTADVSVSAASPPVKVIDLPAQGTKLTQILEGTSQNRQKYNTMAVNLCSY